MTDAKCRVDSETRPEKLECFFHRPRSTVKPSMKRNARPRRVNSVLQLACSRDIHHQADDDGAVMVARIAK